MKNLSKALLSFACTTLLSGPALAQQMDGMKMQDHEGMQSSSGATQASYDLKFIDSMSQHHRMGIDMMKLADQRAKHGELKEMARKDIETQEKQIQQMQAWKADWYPDKKDAMDMNMPGMGSMQDMPMDKLAASSGDAFDKMYIDMMSMHHRGAIKMSKDAVKNAKHQEIRELAQKIIDEHTKEIAQMAKWKKEWKLADK